MPFLLTAPGEGRCRSRPARVLGDRALACPVDNLTGLPFVLIGLFLIVANKSVSEAMVRGNRATFGGRFQGSGWTTWGRFVNYLVGALFLTIGGAVLLGIGDFGNNQ